MSENAPTEAGEGRWQLGPILAVLGCTVAAGANLLVAFVVQRFYRVPVGSELSPQGTSRLVYTVVFTALIVCLPMALAGLALCFRRRQWLGVVLGLLGTGLSLLPHPLFQRLFWDAVARRQLILLP